MISTTAIAALVMALVISILLPTGLLIYFRLNRRLPMKPALVGGLTFLVFSQILEKLLHVYVFTQNFYTMELLNHPWVFAVYGALAAGTFEGVGRYVSFQYLLKSRRDWQDGLSFGLGYGGIEAMLIGASAFGQSLYFAALMNAGTFGSRVGTLLPPEAVAQLQANLMNTPASLWLLGGIERIMALIFQVAAAIFLLYGLRQGKRQYLLYIICIHAFFDFFPAMYQAKLISIGWVEGLLALLSTGALMFIIKSRSLFRRTVRRWLIHCL